MDLETRLQDNEIKLAFLEKELGESREALDDLHAELNRLARRVRALEAADAAEANAAGDGAEDSGAESGGEALAPQEPESGS